MKADNDPQPIKFNHWLTPFSWCYRIGVAFRNGMFKSGLFSRKEFNIPIICVGNISVGGTGKTPHVEYIVNLLKDKYRVAILSRGYKRKTWGYVLAKKNYKAVDIGDEVYQMRQKFDEDVLIAVDSNRVRGINYLLEEENPPQVIVMDDGFQHRSVMPSYVILLSDFSRPFYNDKLLPVGRLRESINFTENANDIIITKCPDNLRPIDYNIIKTDVDAFPYQGLYFTEIIYGDLLPTFNPDINILTVEELTNTDVLLITGIVNPAPLKEYLTKFSKGVKHLKYNDHHVFTKDDVIDIRKAFKKIKNENKILVTTEKDISRMSKFNALDQDILDIIYYIPIEIGFNREEDKEKFDKKLLKHVTDYSRHNKVH